MSNKERCIAILDTFTETQLANIAAMLQAAHDAIDDAFCAALYENYQNDPDKGNFISIEDAAAALEVEL